MIGFLPALLLALFAAGAGTFAGGATFWGSSCAAAAVLGLLLTFGGSWRDPLRLGRAGWVAPLGLVAAVVASWLASPVGRAGETGVLLLPAYLLLPAVLAHSWIDERARRRGLRALAAVVAAVALCALADRFGWFEWAITGHAAGPPRAALPLGHHNLLAAWLVALLPLTPLPAREGGRWRLLGLVSAAIATLALLATGSLAGITALAFQALLAMKRSRRRRLWIATGAVAALSALLLAQGGRLGAIAAGSDPSWQARLVYYRGGLDGFLASPLVGWGPGAAAWTSSAFLLPAPGVSPPGEWTWELHSLPVQLLYELGLAGSLAALLLVGLFFRRRLAERGTAADRGLLDAALVGMAGLAVASLGTGAVAVTALPMAA